MSYQFHARRLRSPRPKAVAAVPAYIPTAPGSALAVKSDLRAATEQAPVLIKETFAQLPPLSQTHGRSGALRAEGYSGFLDYAAAEEPKYGPGNYPQMTTGATDAATGGAVTAVKTALQAIAYDARDAAALAKVSGTFTKELFEEVKKFQKWAGFEGALIDGIVGPLTYGKLKEKLGAANTKLAAELVPSPAQQKKDEVVVGPGPKETVSLKDAKDQNAPFYQKSWFPYAAAGGLVVTVGAALYLTRNR